MNFEKFKKQLSEYSDADVVLRGDNVIATHKTRWSRFKLDRVDKMEEFLNNIYWYTKQNNKI